MSEEWKNGVVSASVEPSWEGGVPHCTASCQSYEGGLCKVKDELCGRVCVPAVEGMAKLLTTTEKPVNKPSPYQAFYRFVVEGFEYRTKGIEHDGESRCIVVNRGQDTMVLIGIAAGGEMRHRNGNMERIEWSRLIGFFKNNPPPFAK